MNNGTRPYALQGMDTQTSELLTENIQAAYPSVTIQQQRYKDGSCWLLCSYSFRAHGVVAEYNSFQLFVVYTPADWNEWLRELMVINDNNPHARKRMQGVVKDRRALLELPAFLPDHA